MRLILFLIIISYTIYKPLAVQSQTDTVYGHWKEVQFANKTGYVLSNAYGLPSNTIIKVFADKNKQNNWGGGIVFIGSPDPGKWWGAGVGQITTGVWPWSNGRNTTNSNLPSQISENTSFISNWTYEFPTLNTLSSWAMYYEIWTHKDSIINGKNITCDIMIQPNYDVNKGIFQGSVIDGSGAKWNAYLNSAAAYEIIHFNRDEKTNTIVNLDLKLFWNFAVEKGWASNTDFVGSITAGMEAFNSGEATFRTTQWSLEAIKTTDIEFVSSGKTQVTIFPNPASSILNIAGINTESIEVTDLTGKILISQKSYQAIRSVNISNISKGHYFISLKEKNLIKTLPFVKN